MSNACYSIRNYNACQLIFSVERILSDSRHSFFARRNRRDDDEGIRAEANSGNTAGAVQIRGKFQPLRISDRIFPFCSQGQVLGDGIRFKIPCGVSKIPAEEGIARHCRIFRLDDTSAAADGLRGDFTAANGIKRHGKAILREDVGRKHLCVLIQVLLCRLAVLQHFAQHDLQRFILCCCDAFHQSQLPRRVGDNAVAVQIAVVDGVIHHGIRPRPNDIAHLRRHQVVVFEDVIVFVFGVNPQCLSFHRVRGIHRYVFRLFRPKEHSDVFFCRRDAGVFHGVVDKDGFFQLQRVRRDGNARCLVRQRDRQDSAQDCRHGKQDCQGLINLLFHCFDLLFLIFC